MLFLISQKQELCLHALAQNQVDFVLLNFSFNLMYNFINFSKQRAEAIATAKIYIFICAYFFLVQLSIWQLEKKSIHKIAWNITLSLNIWCEVRICVICFFSFSLFICIVNFSTIFSFLIYSSRFRSTSIPEHCL